MASGATCKASPPEPSTASMASGATCKVSPLPEQSTASTASGAATCLNRVKCPLAAASQSTATRALPLSVDRRHACNAHLNPSQQRPPLPRPAQPKPCPAVSPQSCPACGCCHATDPPAFQHLHQVVHACIAPFPPTNTPCRRQILDAIYEPPCSPYPRAEHKTRPQPAPTRSVAQSSRPQSVSQ